MTRTIRLTISSFQHTTHRKDSADKAIEHGATTKPAANPVHMAQSWRRYNPLARWKLSLHDAIVMVVRLLVHQNPGTVELFDCQSRTEEHETKTLAEKITEFKARTKSSSPPLTFGATLTTDNTKEPTKHNT